MPPTFPSTTKPREHPLPTNFSEEDLRRLSLSSSTQNSMLKLQKSKTCKNLKKKKMLPNSIRKLPSRFKISPYGNAVTVLSTPNLIPAEDKKYRIHNVHSNVYNIQPPQAIQDDFFNQNQDDPDLHSNQSQQSASNGKHQKKRLSKRNSTSQFKSLRSLPMGFEDNFIHMPRQQNNYTKKLWSLAQKLQKQQRIYEFEKNKTNMKDSGKKKKRNGKKKRNIDEISQNNDRTLKLEKYIPPQKLQEFNQFCEFNESNELGDYFKQNAGSEDKPLPRKSAKDKGNLRSASVGVSELRNKEQNERKRKKKKKKQPAKERENLAVRRNNFLDSNSDNEIESKSERKNTEEGGSNSVSRNAKNRFTDREEQQASKDSSDQVFFQNKGVSPSHEERKMESIESENKMRGTVNTKSEKTKKRRKKKSKSKGKGKEISEVDEKLVLYMFNFW